MIDFDTFTQGLGLEKYPFSVFTAEEEKDFLSTGFVRPLAFSPAVQAAKAGTNIFLYGERGTGKTALLFELISEFSSETTIAQVSDFSAIPITPSQSDVYGFYVSTLAELLFKKLLPTMSDFHPPYKLDGQDKVLLSYLLKNHTTTLSRSALQEDMKKIQHGPVKRSTVWLFNFTRNILNGAAGVAVDLVTETISKSLGLPSPATGGPKEYLQRIDLHVDGDFDEAKASLVLLRKTVALCVKIGIPKLVIVLDRIDEDSRLRNDSDLIANFLCPFLTENEIFYEKDIQFIFSIWSIPFQKVKPDFRANKFCVEQVQWAPRELISVLDKRLQYHSGGKVASHNSLIDDIEFFHNMILPLANANPRDLWQLLNRIIREQYRLNSEARKISTEAMDVGVREFVKNFTYYEYYPRKKEARANSSDVYSYIAHLNKLPSCQFTNNSLSDIAGTGSSTSNYIVGMESIGLVRRCEEKGPNGATLYEIRDPKVRFAVEKKIEIRRDA